MKKSQLMRSDSVCHSLDEIANCIRKAAASLDTSREYSCGEAHVEIEAKRVLDPVTSDVLRKLTIGEVSLIAATHTLGLPDAGHVLQLMRENGLRLYSHSNTSALERAKMAVRAARAPKLTVEDGTPTRS